MSLAAKIILTTLVIIAGLLLGGLFSYFRIKELDARLFPPTPPPVSPYVTF